MGFCNEIGLRGKGALATEPTELEALREPMRVASLEQKLYSILDQMSYIGQ